MKPYYQREGVTLYCGDCAEIEIACDLIVTDPPYGQEFKSGFSDLWGPIHGDDDLAGVFRRVASALRQLRPYRHFYIFGSKFDFSTLPIVTTELIWDKEMVGMGDLSLPWGPQHEKITFGVYSGAESNRRGGGLSARLRRGSVIRSLRPNSSAVKNHPTEKPVEILRQLIESSSVLGETVYDPFAGSGSTLVAAVIEGRKAIGCEIEERYCETAAKRLERESMPLFDSQADVAASFDHAYEAIRDRVKAGGPGWKPPQ